MAWFCPPPNGVPLNVPVPPETVMVAVPEVIPVAVEEERADHDADQCEERWLAEERDHLQHVDDDVRVTNDVVQVVRRPRVDADERSLARHLLEQQPERDGHEREGDGEERDAKAEPLGHLRGRLHGARAPHQRVTGAGRTRGRASSAS